MSYSNIYPREQIKYANGPILNCQPGQQGQMPQNGMQTSHMYMPPLKPDRYTKMFVIIYIIFLLIIAAIILLSFDLYREGSTAYIQRGLNNATKRGITLSVPQ